jgi:hypothetical protein
MQVEYLVTLSLPDEGWDVNQLEEACWQAGQEAGRRLFLKGLEQREEEVLERVNGERKGKVRHYLTTRLGVIIFERQKVRQEEERIASYTYPLDRSIGLKAYQETTLWVKRRACELAISHTYREAAYILSQEIGYEISHRTLHRWVQEQGRRLREKEDERWEEAFGHGEGIANDGKDREIVISEIDATMIHSQKKEKRGIVTKLGVMYSGKELESKKAKHKRYRLLEKTLYAGIEDPEKFGEKLYLKGEEKLSLSQAKNMLLVGDGDPWIKGIAEDIYVTSSYQLDYWHLLRKIRQTFFDEPKIVAELEGYLYSGQGEELLRTVKLARLLCEDREKEARIRGLAHYIEGNLSGLYGANLLKDKVEAKEMLVTSSGAIEKNIEVVIGRRFKRWGMCWTKEGAQNLLKLRILHYDKKDWSAFWQQQMYLGVSLSPN